MTFMIVASPCAVVLATMPPLLAAMANAGRHGVLVKSAVVMEQLGATNRVAFDKTGTLTEGTPRLTGITILPGAGLGERDVLALAAAAENPSEHPLGRAVAAAARDAGLAIAPADEFTAAPGRGVSALICGHRVEIGSPAHLLGDQADAGAAAARRTAGRRRADRRGGARGRDRGRAAGHRGPHPPGRRARRRPDHRGNRRRPGPADRRQPARRRRAWPVRSASATSARACCRRTRSPPSRDLQAQGARVLLVGDGINDAPALAAAAHRSGDGPRRIRPRPRHRRRRHHARRPGHHPRRHHLVPPRPPRDHRQPGHRRRHHHRPGRPGTWPGTCPCRSACSATRAPPSSSASTACGCCAPPPGAKPSPAAPAHTDPGPPSHAGGARAAAGCRAPVPPLAHRATWTGGICGRRQIARIRAPFLGVRNGRDVRGTVITGKMRLAGVTAAPRGRRPGTGPAVSCPACQSSRPTKASARRASWTGTRCSSAGPAGPPVSGHSRFPAFWSRPPRPRRPPGRPSWLSAGTGSPGACLRSPIPSSPPRPRR